MSEKIARYHFAMSKQDFLDKRRAGHFNGFYRTQSLCQVPATPEKFKPLLQLVGSPWGWDNKEMNQSEELLQKRLSRKETTLYHLLDDNRVIGYSLIIAPNPKIIAQLPKTFEPHARIIEIENLGLFPGQEGGGRGGKYFEMLFERLFTRYDYIYWSVSSTNYHSLYNYYKNKLGMTHIGTDYVDDFRPDYLKESQKTAA